MADNYWTRHIEMALELAGAKIPTKRQEGKLNNPDRQLLRLIADGYCIKQIAAEMDLTDRAVEKRCERIRKILGARTTAHAVSIGHREGLLP